MSSVESYDGLCGVIHLNATSDKQVRCKHEFGHSGPHSWVSQVKVFEFHGLRLGGFYHSSTLDSVPWERYDMFKYKLWGADVESDQAIDIEDPYIRRKLIELKVMIDRTGCFTHKFVVASGKVRAYPEAYKFNLFQEFFEKRGEKIPSCYQDDFNSKTNNPQPLYSGVGSVGNKIGG